MTATLPPTAPPTGSVGRRRWITDWRPEDPAFWATTGRRIARRNLVHSILTEHLAFSVWLLWSAVAVSLPAAGFDFSVNQLFWLVAVPNLVGAFLRVPYTAAVGRFGGRNWTVISAVALLLPLLLMTYCLADPGTPYGLFLVAAATAGLGGGNFASSMANISYFYPERHQGFALGVNAAGGNLGVPVVQLLVPLVIGAGLVGSARVEGVWLPNAPLLWLVPVLAAALLAWRFMDNLAVSRATLRAQVACLWNRHNWVMSLLYVGTFGSFIGYSAAFPLLIDTQFPALELAFLAFLGPLVGSLARPLGGWLSDRLGGARVTTGTFAAMAAGVVGVLAALERQEFGLFLGAFLFLFVASGIGNGSTFRMIPAIYRAEALARAERDRTADPAALLARARLAAAVVIGFSSSVGALGGFLIPRGFGMSIASTGSIATALAVFLAGYAVMAGVTWWCYLRRRVLVARLPSLAHASV
jgi:NNP family nitrate/nitrite transporter-like MFS transporter